VGCRTPDGVSPEWSRGAESPPSTCWLGFFDAAQNTIGLLGCECTLVAHVQLFIHQYPQVLLGRAALNPFIPQSELIAGFAPIHVWDLALGLIEPHEVHTGPLLKLFQVPLDGISSFWHVICTTQLSVICKLAEGALDLKVTDENVKMVVSRPLMMMYCLPQPKDSS